VQLIPYVIYEDNDTLFVMQRSPDASEQRLANKCSLGIGGHIRQEDLHETDIAAWALREFEEEVDVSVMPAIEIVGLVYDPRDMVGRVHLGIVMRAIAQPGAHIRIKDEHISGELKTFDEAYRLYDSLESWSQLVLDILASK
jgi:predicted NUDIX family phosphoesterase